VLFSLLSLPIIPAGALPTARAGMTTLVFTSAGELIAVSTQGNYRVFPQDAAYVIDILTAGSGTYTKVTGATALQIQAVGGGGGGTSGEQGVQGGTFYGGMGGVGGAKSNVTMPASFLAASAPYLVGAGGAGGLAPAAGVAGGPIAGGAGGNTMLGSSTDVRSINNVAVAFGGVAVTSGRNAAYYAYNDSPGTGPGNGSAGGLGHSWTAGCGGGGGYVTTASAPGGAGGMFLDLGGTAGPAGGAAEGGDGMNALQIATNWLGYGGGGGGGNRANTGLGRGGHGGQGGYPGGGGGGGGACGLLANSKAGNGGRGGDGILIIMSRR
jgi:hypothetical protein